MSFIYVVACIRISFFSIDFIAKVVFSWWKNWVESTDFSYSPCLLWLWQPLPQSTSCTRVIHLLQLMNQLWHIVITIIITLGFTPDGVHSMGFGTWRMTCIHHYSIIQNSCTAPTTLSALLISLLPLTCGNHWPFYCLYNFAFSRMPYSWNNAICCLFKLPSFT